MYNIHVHTESKKKKTRENIEVHTYIISNMRHLEKLEKEIGKKASIFVRTEI